MYKSILILILLSFLAVTNVAAQDAFTPYQGTQHKYQVNNHTGSLYNWTVYTQLNPLVAANPSAANITGNGSSQITILWNQVGDYYLLVIETDNTGCTNTKAMRIKVLPGSFSVLFTTATSSVCYQASSNFSIPIQFKDVSNGLPVTASHFPMSVTYEVNGVIQPVQTIVFANQNLVISGSSYVTNPNSDTPVEIKITGASDILNLPIPPEIASGQHIHTRTIFRSLIVPTVVALTTNDTTPVISGIANAGSNEYFSVTVNGVSYTPGDGTLSLTGTNWTLTIPPTNSLTQGTYEVTAFISNGICNTADNSSNELIIDTTAPAIPTVISQITNDTTPLINGTAEVGPGEVLTVTVNGITYTSGDGKLILTGTNWSLQIPIGNELTNGTFQVIATVTDIAGNSSTDITNNELIIDTTKPGVIPTVTSLITNDTTPIITGTATVGSGEKLTVTVNGITYTAGDGNLVLTGTAWSLQVPAGNVLTDGIYSVTATVTDSAGNSTSDITSGELTIDTVAPTIPTVVSQITNDTTPTIKGTATVGAGEILKVEVNGVTYTQGDGKLVLTGNTWSLQIQTGNAISDGTCQVTATVTDAAGNVSTDTTTNELTIDTIAPAIPTVVSQTTNSITPVITGTAIIGPGELFTVTLNGITYTSGDGHLTITVNSWRLQIPTGNALTDGVYQVVAKVTDQAGNSSVDTTLNELTIGSNRAPIAVDDAVTTKIGTPVSGNLLTNDSDPDGNKLIMKLNPVSGPANGTIVIKADGSFTYTPKAGFTGQDMVIYEVCDDAKFPACSQAKLKITVEKDVVQITDRLTTNDVNITFINQAVSGNVLINDAGFYGFNSTVGIYLEPVNGTVAMATNGLYTYTPKKDFTGEDNFYYTVCTLENPADCDTVNVTIYTISDVLSQIQPIAVDDEMQTLINTPVTGNVMANDLSVSGEKLMLNLKQKEGPKSGTVVLNANGTFVYTPKSGFTGQDYFVYEICGAISGNCDVARVTITVSDNPSVRLFAADDLFFSYGKLLNGNFIINDKYPSVGTLNVNRTPIIQPKSGSVSINSNGTFSYTPVNGFVGTDQFVYEICDAQLGICDKALVYILVKAPPVVYADLAIQKTGPVYAVPGEEVKYQIMVTNMGTAIANKIQISDYLPAAIQNPKFTVSGTTTSANWTGFYELASLDVNKAFNMVISGIVAANAPDTLKNVASVTSLTWDPVAANNVSVVKTLVNRGPVARIEGAPYVAVGSCNTKGKVLDASSSRGDGIIFSWAPSTYLDNPTSSKPVFRPGKTTRYKLTVTDIKGQKDTTSILVIVPNAPKAITDKNVFVEKPNSTIMLNGSNSTGVGLSYLWLSKEGIILSGATTPRSQVSGLGMYYLNVTDSLGCSAKDSVNVGLYIQAINDTSETKVNESVIINVVKNDIPAGKINPKSISIVTPPLHGIAEVAGDSLIMYLPEDTYIGQDEFVYAICDYFKNCDNAKVLVLINDVPFFVPEAFSPNGDNINDKFEIKGLGKYKTVSVEIFNRWGNMVYQSNNYGNGKGKEGFWDGTIKSGLRLGSGPVPTGTYFYILKLDGKETINGSIYIDR